MKSGVYRLLRKEDLQKLFKQSLASLLNDPVRNAIKVNYKSPEYSGFIFHIRHF